MPPKTVPGAQACSSGNDQSTAASGTARPRAAFAPSDSAVVSACSGQIRANRRRAKDRAPAGAPSYVQARTKPERTKKKVTPERPYQESGPSSGSSPSLRARW